MKQVARILSLIVMFCASSASLAKALYVNGTTGSDAVSYAANGPSSPWRTIGRAAWGSTSRGSPNSTEAARAGDIVYVAAGTYSTPGTGERYGASLNPANSGSASGGYISFEAQGLVVLQISSGTGPVIGAAQRSYIRWKGFYIDEANATYASDTGPIVVYSSNNVIIDGNEVVGFPTMVMDNHNAIRVDYSNNVTIVNNRLHGVTYDPAGWSTSQNGAAIMMYGSRDVTIEHNEIFDSNTGIFPKGLDNYNVVIRRNLIYNCNKGIRISYSHSTLGSNLVYQNVIRDGSASVPESHGINMAEHANNWTIANNTIHNVTNGIYFGSGAYNQSNLVFRNNLITGTNNGFNAYVASQRSFTLDNQNYYDANEWAYNGTIYYSLSAWRSAISGDSTSGTGNPLYVDASIDNLRLQSSSPAINAGVDILDLNNNGSSTDAITLGAYVTGTEQIGRLLVGSTPSNPTRLRRAQQ